MAVFKDYAPGQLFVVTRKNHHKYGQSGIVEKVLPETGSVYGYMADDKKYYFAFNSIAPYPARQQPADQQRQPADADLTPDEVDTLQRVGRSKIWVGEFASTAPYEAVRAKGLIEVISTRIGNAKGVEYTITPAGRAHLAALTSAPADVPTAAADTITVSLSDAYKISVALVAQVIRLTEHIDDPDYEGNTDNLVRIIRETEAVLDRITTQLP